MVELKFVTLDVFATTRYVGNPLAIVHIPKDITPSITQEQKQAIAREFNFSETVFVYDSGDSERAEGNDVNISIFTTEREIRFAGHPTIGTGFHLLHSSPSLTNDSSAKKTTTLVTVAGKIPLTYDSSQGGLVRLEVPHDISIHDALSPAYVARVLGLDESSHANEILLNHIDEGVPVVSIVKGMTFALIRVASLDVLARAMPTGQRIHVSEVGVQNAEATWFVNLYLYYIGDEQTDESGATTTHIRTRMYHKGNLEDPATGSAASALAGFLTTTQTAGRSKQRGGLQIDKYEITQGVEMGRQSDITVEVQGKKVEGEKVAVEKIWLGGKAVEVMKGTLTV